MPYRQSTDKLMARLETSAEGLSSAEAARRLTRDGANLLERVKPVNPVQLFFSQFKSFIIYVLLFAVGLSVLVGEWVDSLIILAILIANALIGFFQELTAHRSLESLKKMAPLNAMVRRDGNWREIRAAELVAGDLIRVMAGDKVPADARLLSAVRLKADEASLTGESIPVEKEPKVIDSEVPLGERCNILFASTAVVAGNGLALVTATGMNTEIGAISRLIGTTIESPTPLQLRLDRFGRKLGYVIIVICLIIFAASLVRGWLSGTLSSETLVGLILVSISLAVAAIPEGLPAIVTISLSIGVKRLLARQALVRRLASVETLGSCDIVCTDKTGTLTKNQMTVRYAWTADAEADISGSGYEPKGEISACIDPLLFRIGLVCNNASLAEKDGAWQITGDPTEAALLVSAAKAGVMAWGERRDELPFDSDRKMMSVLAEEEGGLLVMYCKGAPTELLLRCDRMWLGGSEVPLTAERRREIVERNDHYAAGALRVLGLAFRLVSDADDFAEENMIFVGLQAMHDPPRLDVAAAIGRTRDAGIRVIMVTGDYRETARAIGAEIGISGGSCTGSELDQMSDDELVGELEKGTNIFSRVVPGHKLRIVQALQMSQHIVAMTGDGVNDAPALKAADIGVAVGSGTEVAKEAADFVLLDDSFTHIVNAIEEGRGIYDNIQKAIMLLLSGNLTEVLIIFLSVLFGMNLPLTAILLLWINLVTDGAPALAFSVDPYGDNLMSRPPKPKAEELMPPVKLGLIALLGLVGTAIALTIFALTGGRAQDPEAIRHGQTMVFNFLVVYEMVIAFVIRLEYRVGLFANRWLWGAVVLALGLQGVIMYTPLAQVFQVVPLAAREIQVFFAGGLLVWGIALVFYKFLRLKSK